MKKFGTDKLVTYVVWLSILGGQDEPTLQENARRNADLLPPGPRVVHYADPELRSGKAYGPVIGVPYGSPAWDVYFLFGPGARWKDKPPTPDYWEHQLGGMPSERRLDGPRFAEAVKRFLAQTKKQESPLQP